ncbi:DUF6781 family protein [Variovorax paradoxus]|uniref:Uncharacterized protein n=1 Tax=Variovorax paradoxus TaxID=34073 RepID=A0A0H2LYM9_VARPD|nr:DUF6781 family protein [Variovorax paradoxus]KLN53552.1 hypothetical protein VPARA_53910 [Variovorax paradoxus]
MILKNGIDQAALINKFTDASGKQGEAIRQVLGTVTKAMLDSYATLASGVLIGMSEALRRGGAAKR